MITFEKSISIARPRQEVFDYFVDPASQAEWSSSTESSEWTTDPPHGVGSKTKDVIKLLGRRIESESEITAWDPPGMAASKVTKPFPGEFTARFSEQGEGTKLTLQVQGELSGIFKIAEGLLKGQVEKSFEADLNALKLILESR